MSEQATDILSSDEVDTLQEIMNIAFGQSASDLSEVIDTHVVLSIPFIEFVKVTELHTYIQQHVKEYSKISIVEQKYWGKFKGDALLIFASGAGRELILLLKNDEQGSLEAGSAEILESETLLEVGNILIGACVGKLAELLNDIVTYTPPMVLVEEDARNAVPANKFDPDQTAIILKTDFNFEQGGATGFLFLVTKNESVVWLKKALQLFLEQYE
ncbi:MAG: chemotaxis protein CheC [Nitrospira sp.]|nr:chemotaxis protein CheC [Candidatus Brocadiales bacterium]MBL7049364.1 chemotaxis protein CheC [Nitrospira sp.]